ncbi:hypothetical protein J3459_014974 [Metarhizium acridum]|nr:hypothetical protein J3459_014974 [Metarhizium acridum]
MYAQTTADAKELKILICLVCSVLWSGAKRNDSCNPTSTVALGRVLEVFGEVRFRCNRVQAPSTLKAWNIPLSVRAITYMRVCNYETTAATEPKQP